MAELWIEPDGVKPEPGILRTIYTVPEDSALMWNLQACNQGAEATRFTVERAPEGEDHADAHRMLYNEPIDGYRGYQAVAGFTAVAGTEIRVSSESGNVSFHLSGIQKDQ